MNEIYMRIMYRGIRTVTNYQRQGLVQHHLCNIHIFRKDKHEGCCRQSDLQAFDLN